MIAENRSPTVGRPSPLTLSQFVQDNPIRWAAWVNGCLMVALALGLVPGRLQAGLGWGVSAGLLAAASVVSARAARLLWGSPPRRFWVSMSAACALFAAGNVTQLAVALRHPASPEAVKSSAATAGLGGLAAVVLIGVMLSYPSGAGHFQARLQYWLDLCVVSAAAAMFGTYFATASLAATDVGLGQAVAVASGPVLLCLAGLGVAKLILSGTPPFTRLAGILGAGAAVTSGVSSGLAPVLAGADTQRWFFVLAVLANMLVLASARAQYLAVETEPQVGKLSTRRRFSVLPYLTVLAAYCLLVAGLRGYGLPFAAWSIVIGATACTSLVVVRQLVAFTENSRLLAQRDLLMTELEYLAFHDGLTGLTNRTLFFDRADTALAAARRTAATTAVVLIDLDGFKEVNDLRGHHAGDAVLVATADRLRANVRQADTVARLGGDEFALLLVDVDPAALPEIAQRLLSVVSEPLEVEGGTVQVGCSIGIALEPGSGNRDVAALTRAADEVMYQAKAEGRGTVVFEQSSDLAAAEQ